MSFKIILGCLTLTLGGHMACTQSAPASPDSLKTSRGTQFSFMDLQRGVAKVDSSNSCEGLTNKQAPKGAGEVHLQPKTATAVQMKMKYKDVVLQPSSAINEF
jgi:hypothetical protein